MTESTVSLLDFPCDFPIKAMGRATADFDLLVVSIVRKHVPDITEAAVTTRMSRDKRYMSVTVSVQAQSREQLDNIYLELSANKQILVAL